MEHLSKVFCIFAIVINLIYKILKTQSMMRRFALICLILFFSTCLPKSSSLFALTNTELPARTDLKLGGVLYTGKQLSSSAVKAVCQDRYGFVWIGTDYGSEPFSTDIVSLSISIISATVTASAATRSVLC
jgi:hypothetical protein